jgi:transposase
MVKPYKTKAERAVTMLLRGASTASIVKTLNVSPQYVYNIRSRINKQNKDRETVTNSEPQQLELKLEKLDEVVNQHQEHIKAHIEALNNRSKTQSIQGEYGKHQQMSTWQRIKAAIGF